MHERILEIVEKEEVSWKTIIFDLVREGKIDPWDVDISLLAQSFLEKLRALKRMDLKLGGKVVLASALLLRLKSKRLVNEEIAELDRLLSPAPEPEVLEFYDQLESELAAGEKKALMEEAELLPRLPQPRKRKVSVFELVRALERALEVRRRRMLRQQQPLMRPPERTFDIVQAISGLWSKLVFLARASPDRKVTFSSLVPGCSKKDKVFTLIPLLHLSNDAKVLLEQEKHFSEIHVTPVEEGNEVNS